jgi:hypothetical protein
MPIADNVPSSTGGPVTSYSVVPALPSGLSLNPATGVISGTPAALAPTAIYTVSATNSGGSASVGLSLTVRGIVPTVLSYAVNPASYLVGVPIAPNAPSYDAGTITSFTVSPALPAGLSLNPTTGVITGTPFAPAPATAYTVTGFYSGGSISVPLSLQVTFGMGGGGAGGF